MTRTEPPSAAPRHRVAGGFLGLLSGAAALGVAQLIAGLLGGQSSPMIAVGSASIDAAPSWVKEFAIRTFGTNDKRALLIGIAVILAIVAIVLGIASIRRPRVGIVGLVAFGAIGLAAALTRPNAGPSDAIPSIVGTAVGIWVFRWLRRQTGLPDPATPPPKGSPTGSQQPPGLDRRKFVVGGMYTVVLAAVTGVAGQYFVRRSAASASRSAVRIPAPSSPLPAPPAGTDVGVPG